MLAINMPNKYFPYETKLLTRTYKILVIKCVTIKNGHQAFSINGYRTQLSTETIHEIFDSKVHKT